jgi:hypothetical protein
MTHPTNQSPATLNSKAEQQRLADANTAPAWRAWGPYLSERAWGTVREDYSATGDAWNYFSHDMARSRTYRWSEDGIGGISDDKQILCFAAAFWNGRDPILKERMFGLTNAEGNHGEDVKEYWFYQDNTPSHSYMKMTYRYPHAAFPYRELVEINRHRGADQPEYELVDTGVFADNAFFDIQLEYAKADTHHILFRCTVRNCGGEAAELHVLPTLWFRNTWSWDAKQGKEPVIRLQGQTDSGDVALIAEHPELGQYRIYSRNVMETLFTFNETNRQKLYGAANTHPAVKDAFHEYVVQAHHTKVHQQPYGTKAAVHQHWHLAAGETQVVEVVLVKGQCEEPFKQFNETFEQRKAEADAFYADMLPKTCDQQLRQIQRLAIAGVLWSKQFYHYDVRQWLKGDGDFPAPAQRMEGRNSNWRRLKAYDVIVMPDKWEYPWFASWDWAFHCLTLCYVDIDMAKSQLELICSERFQNLSGQLPSYEWAFGDVNPPVQALAAWRVYNKEKRVNNGNGDRAFLERVYHKLLLNFVWWVNRKDSQGQNVFEGGFLGLDNISVFDRSEKLPNGEKLEQADATGWMGLFCLNMMMIGLELAQHDPVYSHLAVKFFDHFLAISKAINGSMRHGDGLWDQQDGFYYDKITTSDGNSMPLRLRSNVGLIPLYAAQVLEKKWIENLPAIKNRLESEEFQQQIKNQGVGCTWSADGSHCLLSICHGDRLKRALARVVDENEFLSQYGIRSLSRQYLNQPYHLHLDGIERVVQYEPAESHDGAFGGNSNWRGPIWFPTAYLLITSLRTYNRFYGDSIKVPRPGVPGEEINLLQLSEELARRMISIFVRDDQGHRPVFGGQSMFQDNPLWKDFILFHEYFQGDNGAGIGASHQTGWTALVVQLIDYVTRNYQHTGG